MKVLHNIANFMRRLFRVAPKKVTHTYPDPSYVAPLRNRSPTRKKFKMRGYDGTMFGPFRSSRRWDE